MSIAAEEDEQHIAITKAPAIIAPLDIFIIYIDFIYV